MPSYWLAVVLVLVFAYWWRVFPAFGAQGLDAEFLSPAGRLGDRLRHLALPLVTLTLIGIGGIARYVRGSLVDLQGSQFLTVARAKGLSRRAVLLRHALPNALIPVLILLGLSLPALFSGAVFVEAIFAWPGVGRLLVTAVQARDYPVVLAATTISAALVVLGSLLADGLVVMADPRLGGMRSMRDGRARFGIACLVVLALIAVLAPWISSGDPALQRDVVATRFLPPLTTDVNGMFHLLGTDRLGRDVWTRLAFGARVSLGVGLLGVSLSVLIGVLVGGVAGASRGVVSRGLLAVTDFALALPRVVLLLLLATLWAPGVLLVVIVLGVTGWMPVARLVHGEVRKLMAQPFVESAVAHGCESAAGSWAGTCCRMR